MNRTPMTLRGAERLRAELKQLKSEARPNVIKAIADTHGFAGASGTYTFLPSGDPIRPSVSVYRVESGAWTFWQPAS